MDKNIDVLEMIIVVDGETQKVGGKVQRWAEGCSGRMKGAKMGGGCSGRRKCAKVCERV